MELQNCCIYLNLCQIFLPHMLITQATYINISITNNHNTVSCINILTIMIKPAHMSYYYHVRQPRHSIFKPGTDKLSSSKQKCLCK